ncbi:MAG: M23 family metallopeptidase [Deltaproteobacteria bacterium]|nr:M23 family metallopeptidase [Deltaproteobacteria bacterium]
MTLFKRILFFLCIVLINQGVAGDQDVEFIDPREVPQGGITLFHIPGVNERVTASLDGGEVILVNGVEGMWGVVAVDFETAPGGHELVIKVNGKGLRRLITVLDGGFGVQYLRLPRYMVELDARTLKRVQHEADLIKDVWTKSVSTPLWQGQFIMPVDGVLSSPFGFKRVINGQHKTPHTGIDIGATEGTPVRASNRGRVALVGDFFFYGRSVIIDHGLGLFTMYFHLKDVSVGEGVVVEKGAVIGEVGMTGRATSPHLHFGVRVGRARVSPNQFIQVSEGWHPEGEGLIKSTKETSY